MPARASTNVAPPKVFIPTTKAAHKQSLFHSFKDLLGLALAYTIKYKDDPDERDFIHYLDDVIKTLPMDEESVSMCALLLFRNIMSRAETNPLRVVEHVDESLPAPQPVQMHCSDGTSTMIEQEKVKSSKLHLTPQTAFEFKGNTPALLPVPVPYTLTFTPTASKSTSGSAIHAMSYDVLKSGYLKERKAPRGFPEKDGLEGNKTYKPPVASSPSVEPEPKPLTDPTLSGRGTATEQTPIVAEHPKSFTSTEPVEPIPVPESSKGKTKSKRKSKTKARGAEKPQTSASTASIPFPSISSSPRKVSPTVAADPKPNDLRHNASLLPNDKEDYQFAVNHFPPHPHASDSQAPPPGRRIGLQRSYAFSHKSHPEIFWNEAWGEKPSEGQTHPVEDRPQPLLGKQNGKARCDKSSEPDRPVSKRSRSPLRIPSSGSAMHAVVQLASVKQGKKRAREEIDVDVEERPNQRRRASMSGGADSPKRLSQRLSGLKKAVKNIAEAAFTR